MPATGAVNPRSLHVLSKHHMLKLARRADAIAERDRLKPKRVKLLPETVVT